MANHTFNVIFKCSVIIFRRQKNGQEVKLFMSRRGENIYKRKDGRWEGRYIKQRINGKSHYGYVYAKTYKETKEKLKMAEEHLGESSKTKEQVGERASELIFQTAAEAWLEFSKPQLKESSVVKYSNVLSDYLVPCFGEQAVETITWEEISDFSSRLLLSGGRNKKGLSPKTVTGILSILKNVLAYAAKYEKSRVVDISQLSIKQAQLPMRILSRAEQERLSRYLCSNLTLSNLGIMVCLYTGIRIGEVCALRWEDISFEEQYLYVNKTMQRLQRQGDSSKKTSVMISKPKSDCSIRKIPLPNDLFQHILAEKRPEKTFFLTGQTHKFVEPRTLQYRFKAILKACSIPDANFHALRHTFATRCVELGFDVKSLSEILGHASVNITMNRYVHPSMELKQKHMNMLSGLLSVK